MRIVMTVNRAFVRNSQQTQYTILMEVLGDLSQEITMHLEPGALSSSLLTAARRVVPCDRAQIYLYHHDKQELSPVEGAGDKIDLKRTDSLSAWSAKQLRPLLYAPASVVEAEKALLLEEKNTAEMAVPFISKHVLYGVISLKRATPFNNEELNALRNLSNIAAVALDNMSLTGEVARQKASFLSLITHELRSPLNNINGYLDLALDGVAGELNEQLREFIQRARAGSEQMFSLIENLLLLARVDAGQWRLNREIISLQNVITDAVEEQQLTAIDNNITLVVEGVENFPPLYADEVRLQQVVRNLVSNALRFTDAGGQVTVSARIEKNKADSGVSNEHKRVAALEVTDTGCGMAPEFQQHIFERFYHIPNVAVSRKGLGLGLTIVKMIVEMHGGFVTGKSVPAQGSTFRCVLPCLFS